MTDPAPSGDPRAGAPDDEAPRRFQPLGDYDWPALPAEDTVARWWDRVRDAFRDEDPDAPFVADAALDRFAGDRLDRIAPPPACGPLLEDMTATLQDWLAQPNGGDTVRLIVMPPCEGAHILALWAGAQGLEVLNCPERGDAGHATLLSRSDHGPLVIPALETWFLRTADGLAGVRALLDAVSRTDRRCVIGCNSWAWRYLCKAADAQAFLPKGLTFQAFDGARLQGWFRELTSSGEAAGARFRVSSSGTDLFGAAENGSADYFTRLAALSLGIPWVAWRMWRNAMRTRPDPEVEDKAETAEPGRRTIWLTRPDTFAMPPNAGEMTLLTLQSLLIHGALSPEDLARTLPGGATRASVPALLKAQMLVLSGTDLRCNPAAYPAIRTALSDAGFNMDEL